MHRGWWWLIWPVDKKANPSVISSLPGCEALREFLRQLTWLGWRMQPLDKESATLAKAECGEPLGPDLQSYFNLVRPSICPRKRRGTLCPASMKCRFLSASFLGVLLATPAIAQGGIKVGEFCSLTGDNASFGITQNQGVQLAVQEINEAGGVLGKTWTLSSKTTKPDREKRPRSCEN
jgi:hypothetical protein